MYVSFWSGSMTPLTVTLKICIILQTKVEGKLLVMFRLKFLLQIFSQLCFHLQDLIKIVRLLLADVTIIG